LKQGDPVHTTNMSDYIRHALSTCEQANLTTGYFYQHISTVDPLVLDQLQTMIRN
jgi:hypothetical protein